MKEAPNYNMDELSKRLEQELALKHIIAYESHSVPPQRLRKATPESAGYDIAVSEGGWVWPFCYKAFPTGLQFFMAPGHTFHVQVRSSVFKKGLIICNSPIDPDYRWKMEDGNFVESPGGFKVPLCWHILVRNVRLLPLYVQRGARLGQIVIPDHWQLRPASEVLTYQTTFLAHNWSSARGGGFGSTGQ